MRKIIPAILPESFTELEKKVSLLVESAPVIQIDFCDGNFVSTKSWGFNNTDNRIYQKILAEEESLPYWDSVDYELDLMVKNAHQQFDMWLKLGPKRIVFHLEAEDNLLSFFEKLDPYYKDHIEFGLAINIHTSAQTLELYYAHVQFIQCMGIDPIGMQGSKFNSEVIRMIDQIHKAQPKMLISVDGGINLQNINSLIAAGVSRFVIGSAIFNSSHPLEAFEAFQA